MNAHDTAIRNAIVADITRSLERLASDDAHPRQYIDAFRLKLARLLCDDDNIPESAKPYIRAACRELHHALAHCA